MTALVTKHLPLVAGAPDGIKKLRELILDLAVRGRLVSQDTRDAPAKDFIEQTTKAKNLILKKSKERQSAAPEQLKPSFSIPNGWQWVRLGDLTSKIGAGSTPLGGKQAYVASGIKFLRSQNVWNEGLRLDDVALIAEATHLKMSSTHIKAGDLLFNITGASIGRCAVVPDSFDTGNVSQHVTIIRPISPEIRQFLHLVLMSTLIQDAVMAAQVGVSREGLSIGKLAEFFIPLPPLAEQHRIVAKVDELLALCDKLEADQAGAEAAHAQLVQALLERLTQAKDAEDFQESWRRLLENFHTLFTTEASIDFLKQSVLQLGVMGKLVQQLNCDENASYLLARASACKQDKEDKGFRVKRSKNSEKANAEIPFKAPKGWAWAKKSEILCFLNGYAFKSEWFTTHGVKLLRNINLAHGSIDWRNSALISEEQAEEFHEFSLKRNDLVISLDRPIISTGLKIAIIRDDDLPALLLQRVAKISSYADIVIPRYLYIWFNSRFFVDSIDPGRSNGVPHISTNQIGTMLLAIPPLAEQHRIVAKVDELMALCDRLKANLTDARHQHSQLASALVDEAAA